jgi:hypothetical protein
MKNEQLTIKQAIEQGYTCALSEDADYYTKLDGLTDEDLEHHKLFLGSKETFKFSISAKEIESLIEQHIENQDEVNDESETFYTEIGNIDYDAIAALINPVFKTNYHSVTDIQLIKETQIVTP